jgi:hypothetical protein
VVKLRWQYGVDGAWRALGTGGRTYVVEPNAQGRPRRNVSGCASNIKMAAGEKQGRGDSLTVQGPLASRLAL